MSARLGRLLLIAGAIVMTATLAAAQDPPRRGHVRGATAEGLRLLTELTERSQLARDMVAHLERSDVVVYVRYEWLQSQTLRGRIGFLASGSHPRLLAIGIEYRRTRTEQLAALGHELQHAVEIADADWVTDTRSLASFYSEIGEASGSNGGNETYETVAAAEMGRRVRAELNGVAAVTADTAGVRD